MDKNSPRKFDDFWSFYVHEHRHPWNRRLHFLGTSLALVFLFAAAIWENPWFLLAAVVSGYGFAWIGHFFIERNRPATLKRPLHSLKADFRMFYLILNGKMDGEIEKTERQP